MTQRLSVTHTTSLAYEGEVVASFNEARMTPLSTSGQLMLRHELSVSPLARIHRYTDYWGTAVEAFDVHLAAPVADRDQHVGGRHRGEVAPGARGQLGGPVRGRRSQTGGASSSSWARSSTMRGRPGARRPRRALRSAATPAAAIELAIGAVERAHRLHLGCHPRAHLRRRGLGRRTRRVSGLQPQLAVAAACRRDPGALRQRLHPRRGRRDRRARGRREPRLGGGVERRLGGARPHQRPTGRRGARGRRPGSGLPRCVAADRHLRRTRSARTRRWSWRSPGWCAEWSSRCRRAGREAQPTPA